MLHGSLCDQEVEAILLPTDTKLMPTGLMAIRFTRALGKRLIDAKKAVLSQLGGQMRPGSVAMFPDIETDLLHRRIFCTNTTHYQGEVPS